jgi:hypothetical protein
MALLVHLRVLTVRRLGVAAAVSTGADMYVAVWGRILSHALRQAWTLRAILRRRVVVGGRRLVPDGWQLRVGRPLSWDTDSLSRKQGLRRGDRPHADAAVHQLGGARRQPCVEPPPPSSSPSILCGSL